MLRVVLEGKDAEEYLNLRKRNSELAKEVMDLRARVNGKPKSNITLVVDNDGNVKDVKETPAPRKRFGIF
jgi:hypothetical protein